MSAGESFSLNIKSRFQLRHQLEFQAPDTDSRRESSQVVNVNTTRIWLSGNAYSPRIKYLMQLAVAGRDYRDGATSPIFDAYVDIKAHRDLSFRVGQFFVPFDRLRTVREWALQMAERPRPIAEFTLDRDVGVVVYSDHFLADASPLAFRLGAFGGGGTNLTRSKPTGALIVTRLELRPVGEIDDDVEGDLARLPRPRVALGLGAASNINTNRLRSTTGTTFAGGTTDYSHAAADVVFKWSGFAVQGEVLWQEASADAIVSTSDDDEGLAEFTRSGHGWVVQASYVFDPPLELVGRFTRTLAHDRTDPTFIDQVRTRGEELAAGANYYLNGHKLKLQTTWIALMPGGLEFDEASHAVLTQLDATF